MTETDEQLYRRQDRAYCDRHKQLISLSDGCPDCAAEDDAGACRDCFECGAPTNYLWDGLCPVCSFDRQWPW